ncbi:pimeloyl-ACP methyl ester esterase BioH [Bergeriella denitrificans]|uniref:BioH - biotin biosynthesis protein n=1 Tax=Bergeriella denitrificans TaxID=494 RepID=A0A378UKY6_BERDE|nr:pimeloyl-ACP methyl ester esterase BioH [Bergeriella denitrificans]STZ77161.1 bioH - biotin biosynthesis protein [Bergeriella denitrificans]
MPNSVQKVYLIHGWGANRHVFDDLIPRLPASWDIHNLDLPGHGGAPDIEPFDIAAIADRFAADIDSPAHILGWSLGGLAALNLAARHPEKVRSLCLTASFAKLTAAPDYLEGLDRVALGKMVGLFRQDYAKYIKQFLQLQLLNTPDAADILSRILPDLAALGAPSALQSALEAVEQADARPLLPETAAPALLVFGGKDAVTPPRMGEYLQRHLPESEFHLIEKAAHAPFLSHAGEFARIWTDFVVRHSTAFENGAAV